MGGPPRSRQTTGKPWARASVTTQPPSSCRLGKRNTDASSRIAIVRSSRSTQPRNSTRSATPSRSDSVPQPRFVRAAATDDQAMLRQVYHGPQRQLATLPREQSSCEQGCASTRRRWTRVRRSLGQDHMRKDHRLVAMARRQPCDGLGFWTRITAALRIAARASRLRSDCPSAPRCAPVPRSAPRRPTVPINPHGVPTPAPTGPKTNAGPTNPASDPNHALAQVRCHEMSNGSRPRCSWRASTHGTDLPDTAYSRYHSGGHAPSHDPR